MCLDRKNVDYAPFDARGGLGKMVQLFGEPADLAEEIIENIEAGLENFRSVARVLAR